MAETVREIKDWLNSLTEDELVGIDEGGLTLRVVGRPDVYYEIGGIPEED